MKDGGLFLNLLRVFKNRKNKEYMNAVWGWDKEDGFIKIEYKDNCLGKTPVLMYDSFRDCGLFACVRRILNVIYFCDKFGLIPFFDMTNSLYFDKDLGGNPFDYYFEKIKIDESFNIDEHPLIISKRDFSLIEKESQTHGYIINEKYYRLMSYTWSKYLKFNNKTIDSITRYCNLLNINHRTLGVHIRGTDYKKSFNEHPIFIDESSYYPVIDEALETNLFDKIFIATDDEEILNSFIHHYGRIVVFSSDVKRGSGDVGVHSEKNEENNKCVKYKIGLDAICDMAALSYCGGIITGLSQVARSARFYKLSRGETYLIDKIIDCGIYKNKKMTVDQKRNKSRK